MGIFSVGKFIDFNRFLKEFMIYKKVKNYYFGDMKYKDRIYFIIYILI